MIRKLDIYEEKKTILGFIEMDFIRRMIKTWQLLTVLLKKNQIVRKLLINKKKVITQLKKNCAGKSCLVNEKEKFSPLELLQTRRNFKTSGANWIRQQLIYHQNIHHGVTVVRRP